MTAKAPTEVAETPSSPTARTLHLVETSQDGPAAAASAHPTFADAKKEALDIFEARYLADLLTRAGGNLSLAARMGDLARHHLRALLRKHGLYRAPASSTPEATG